MSSSPGIVGNFKLEYDKLDSETQVALDNFIAGVEEVGQDIVGETVYYGTSAQLDKFMPCLQALSTSISSIKIDLPNENCCFRLNWEPNDFIIPQEVLARVNKRHTKMFGNTPKNLDENKETDEDYESDDLGLLTRTASGPSSYDCFDDNVPSV